MPLAVIALGGNAFARAGRVGTPGEQIEAVREAARDVVDLVEYGLDVVVTHGNGPQAGLLAERVSDYLTLDMIDAATEGWMGYLLANAIMSELRARGISKIPVAIVTRVTVDEYDESFKNPTKYIGPIYSEGEAERLAKAHGWVFKVDPRGGFRRVVASPEPKGIVEMGVIKALLKEGYIPIAVGGGGIPVVVDGEVRGVEAVVDKDLASQVLANGLGADYLIILTDVDYVYLNYGKPNQRRLVKLTVDEAERHLAEGQFPPGSMGPKVEAAIRFIRNGGKAAYIGPLGRGLDVYRGLVGTLITP